VVSNLYEYEMFRHRDWAGGQLPTVLQLITCVGSPTIFTLAASTSLFKSGSTEDTTL
jgi:hypothetical protein